MSSFSGLNTALSGLLAHKRTIDMIGHNISNVETEGFSRRRVDLTSSGSIQPPGRYSTYWTNSNLGVDVERVTRIRDEFLETKARTELGNEAAQNRMAEVLVRIEAAFPEPSDEGVQAQLAKFWNAWSDAANRPGDIATRTAVLEQAKRLAQTFAGTARDLTAIRTDLGTQLDTKVAEVNAMAGRIAELNEQIRVATVGGADASDLLDERDLLVDRLVTTTGATVRPAADGQVDVLLGGSTLVAGKRADTLSVVANGPLDAPLDTLPFGGLELRWGSDGYPVAGFGGELGGLLTGANDLVPRYLHELDGVAAQLVSTVNALHTTGQGLDTVNDVNLDFFDPTGVTAATLALSSDVADQPSRLALATAGAGALDTTIANALAGLATSTTGADALHRTLVGRLGIETQTAESRASIQQLIRVEADTARRGVSGVNLDEEMTNLIASQRAYEASARLITSIDEMLDVLINRTGTVGR